MTNSAEQGERSQPQAAAEVEVPGKANMPGAPDPMAQAAEAMRRAALETPSGGEMPKGGMPEGDVEQEERGTA